MTKWKKSHLCWPVLVGAGISHCEQSKTGICGKRSLSLHTLRNFVLRNTRKETEFWLETHWSKSNRWQAGCFGHSELNSFLVATPAQAVTTPAAGFCPVFHSSLLTLQSCAGIAFSSGRQWSRLEGKQSQPFSCIGYSSAESNFSTQPECMDMNAAAGTQWLRARSKTLERTAGWGSDWPEQICHQMPDHYFCPGSAMESLCLLI